MTFSKLAWQYFEVEIFQGNLCNDHVYAYGSSRGILISLALLVLTLMA